MNRWPRNGFAWLLAVVVAGLLFACTPAPVPFANTDISGIDYAHDFALTDQNGKARTLADFHGKVVVVFFGYTQCPDVCPTTMADLAAAMQQLSAEDASRVQVLFITLDPERDTPALLAAYVPAFDKRFLGLYGTLAQTAAVAKEFKVFYEKVPGPTPTSYTLDHTSGSYVFDPDGHVRLYLHNREGTDPVVAPIVHDLKLLLHPPGGA